MTGTERAKENMTCTQCGRPIFKGDTAWWCLEGLAAHLPIPGIGKMPKYFCSEGCLNAYKGSFGGGRGFGGAAKGAAAGFAAGAGAAVGKGAVKGIGWVIKWCFMIGLPLSLFMVMIFSIKECASTSSAGALTGVSEYIVEEPADKLVMITSDMLLSDDFLVQADEQASVGNEKLNTVKRINKADIPTNQTKVLSLVSKEYDDLVDICKEELQARVVDAATVKKAKSEMDFSLSDWDDAERVIALANSVKANVILIAKPTSVKFEYTDIIASASVDSKIEFDLQFLDTSSKQIVSGKSGTYMYKSNIFGDKVLSRKGFVDADAMYLKTLAKDILTDSGKWTISEVKQSKYKYPDKKYSVCPFGTQKWTVLEGKKAAKVNKRAVAGLSFASDSVQITFADGSVKSGTYTLNFEAPQEKQIKVKASVANEHSNTRITGTADTFAETRFLHFYDACFGTLSVKTEDGEAIFKNAPVYHYKDGEFALLAGYTGGTKGKAQFLYFEK
ncbi:MAG: hypothetical protein K6G80_02040 [Treponema sp.]|nr:hypothetical protein [Treponema sp.]